MSGGLKVRRLVGAAVLVTAAGLLGPGQLLAHPLGNFTVNRYSRLEIDSSEIRVHYVLDMAEIPALQERQVIDVDRDRVVTEAEWEAYKLRKVEEIRQGLELTVDGAPVALELRESILSTPPGQADLSLLRIEIWYGARLAVAGQRRAVYRDRNEPARIGWRELVVRAGPEVHLVRSNVPSEDISDELRAYPDNLLQRPLDRRQAEWEFTTAGVARPSTGGAPAGTSGRAADPLTSLITVPE